MKKPKVWDIAVLSGVALVIITLLMLSGREKNVLAIDIVLVVYFVCAIIMLIYAFFRQLKYNIYSYNTIYYMGFALFLSYLAVSHVRLAALISAHPETYTFRSVFDNLLSSGLLFIMWTLPFIVVFSVALCISNISLIRHEGRRTVNLLGVMLSVLMIAGAALLYLANSSFYVSGQRHDVLKLEILCQLMTTIYLYCECMLIGAIVADLIAALHYPSYDKDYVVILGCGFRSDGMPTPLLKGRIDKAIEFADKQKEKTGKRITYIASGGQGPDEPMPESRCIRNYLVSRGVPEERIIEENKSKSTFENMSFTKEKLIEEGCDIPETKIAFATTNYHVFRSGLYAKRVKLQAEGMGAKTKWYFWPNASVREFVGLMTEHKGKQALVLGGMLAVYLTLTVISVLH